MSVESISYTTDGCVKGVELEEVPQTLRIQSEIKFG